MVRTDSPLTCTEDALTPAAPVDYSLVPQPWKEFKLWVGSVLIPHDELVEEKYNTLLTCWKREQAKRAQ